MDTGKGNIHSHAGDDNTFCSVCRQPSEDSMAVGSGLFCIELSKDHSNSHGDPNSSKGRRGCWRLGLVWGRVLQVVLWSQGWQAGRVNIKQGKESGIEEVRGQWGHSHGEDSSFVPTRGGQDSEQMQGMTQDRFKADPHWPFNWAMEGQGREEGA